MHSQAICFNRRLTVFRCFGVAAAMAKRDSGETDASETKRLKAAEAAAAKASEAAAKAAAKAEAAAKAAASVAKAVPPAVPKPAAPTAADSGVAATVVPVVRIAGGGAAAASDSDATGRPKIPAPSAAPPGVNAREYMRQICPWVIRELPLFMELNSDTGKAAMHLREPLKISAGALSSYKESWCPTHCAEALRLTGLYEAGANATWIDPEVAGADESDDPAWEWVYEYSERGFEAIAYNNIKGKRIRFPIALESYWENYKPDAESPAFPTSLKLLTAHGHLWAWYVAVWRAMCDDDKQRVLALYECALTVTVTTRTDVRKESLARDVLLFSERVRDDAKTLVINFVTFADKLQDITGGKHDLLALQKMKLHFCGGLINASMLKVAHLVVSVMSKDCRKLLSEIDRRFGRDVLSSSYNKIRLLITGCQHKSVPVESLLFWCLETMLVMLKRKECSPSDFTVLQFSKGRDGTPSWIAQAIALRAIVEHMQSILDNVAHVDAALANTIRTEVFDKMASPTLYNQVFPKVEAKVDVQSDDEDQNGERLNEEAPGDAFMEELRSKLPKAGIMFAEALRKLYDNSYEDDIIALATESDFHTKQCLDSLDDKSNLKRDLNDMMRAIHIAESVVGTTTGTGPPKASLRELIRHNSAPEDREAAENERADVWRQAQTQRKKLVTLGLVKDAKDKNSYIEVFRKATATRGFKGEANEHHRAFVVSADLLFQCGKEPWLQPSMPREDVLQAALEFITSHRDTFDVSVAFDGTMRKVRRLMEDHFLALPSSAEFAIVYDKAPNSCFQRRNFMSHRNVEMGYVKMPVSRNKVVVKDRAAGFGASGETSSTYTSYSGVKALHRTALAMISPADKAKIFSDATDPLPKLWASRSNGVPLFWQETKSFEFWGQLCDELSIKCMVDVSPGSGILAECCMAKGIPYFGVCASAQHLNWLSNVLDRAALKYIVESGTFLYQEDLATHIKELFADVLQPLEASEEDEQAVQASDDEPMD